MSQSISRQKDDKLSSTSSITSKELHTIAELVKELTDSANNATSIPNDILVLLKALSQKVTDLETAIYFDHERRLQIIEDMLIDNSL